MPRSIAIAMAGCFFTSPISAARAIETISLSYSAPAREAICCAVRYGRSQRRSRQNQRVMERVLASLVPRGQRRSTSGAVARRSKLWGVLGQLGDRGDQVHVESGQGVSAGKDAGNNGKHPCESLASLGRDRVRLSIDKHENNLHQKLHHR